MSGDILLDLRLWLYDHPKESLTTIDLISRAEAEIARMRGHHRWNIEEDGPDLLICEGAHASFESCEFVRYRRV